VEITTPSAIGSAPPDKPVGGAARHDRHVQRAADVQDRQHLLFVVRQRDDHRQLAVGRQPVTFVRTGVLEIGQDAALRQFGAQGGRHLTSALGIHGDGSIHLLIVSTITSFCRMLVLSF